MYLDRTRLSSFDVFVSINLIKSFMEEEISFFLIYTIVNMLKLLNYHIH